MKYHQRHTKLTTLTILKYEWSYDTVETKYLWKQHHSLSTHECADAQLFTYFQYCRGKMSASRGQPKSLPTWLFLLISIELWENSWMSLKLWYMAHIPSIPISPIQRTSWLLWSHSARASWILIHCTKSDLYCMQVQQKIQSYCGELLQKQTEWFLLTLVSSGSVWPGYLVVHFWEYKINM